MDIRKSINPFAIVVLRQITFVVKYTMLVLGRMYTTDVSEFFKALETQN